ncbi:AMP-binding protein [Amycolatopsis sp. YIM 10]|uniref:AMP-binding protein n=1 Tax=Amycolatopsis sp. YIM 10 TaxID=2653857 RepID=UPI00129025F8|nr:AMP-binding protein [Amycolatopsis sp. YIM 10]QFU86903.1 Long-chain-fatty-acid--CoA ligase FadD15 [Amycolatopsis sp. YIM 10]
MTDVAGVECPHAAGGTVRTLGEAFQRTARMRPGAVALRVPGGKQEITWREYEKRVRALAAGLAAHGVTRGATVGMMLSNRPEAHLVDTAALHLGATPFSIYNTSSPEQIAYLFGNAENQVVITERQFLDRITASGAKLDHVVLVDGEAEGTITLAQLESAGAEDFDLDAAWKAVEPGDVATLIYTSGTTGPPKGVEITHANVMAEARALLPHLEPGLDDRITSYLPSAHVADRMSAHYLNLVRGVQITCVDDPRAIAAALPDALPTIWVAVPRVWQKIRGGIETKLAAEPKAVKRNLANWAIGVGRRVAVAKASGGELSPADKIQHAIADKIVLSKLRHALGLNELRWAVSGAAAIPPETLEYFLGLGLPVYEVWGMSETTAAATTNAPGAFKIGSVGKAMEGVELKLAEDGELLCRGALITPGYHGQPDKTAEAIDADGWLHTGDIATIDADGFVTIVDRKKELIINEAGKNMSPTNIENALKAASPLIAQVVAIGDAKAYVTALVVLDPEMVAARASEFGLSDPSVGVAAQNEGVRAAIAEAVRAGNQKLNRAEQVKRFLIVPSAWDPGGDELTPKMSLRRKPIADKYRTEIDGLYEASPGPQVVDLG